MEDVKNNFKCLSVGPVRPSWSGLTSLLHFQTRYVTHFSLHIQWSASAYYIKRHRKGLRDHFKDVLRLCAAHQLCLSPAPVIQQSYSPPPTFSTPLPRFSPTTPTCSHFFSELGKNREGHLRWQMPLRRRRNGKKRKKKKLRGRVKSR